MAEQRVIVVGVDLEENGDRAIRAALRRRVEVPALSVHFVFVAEERALPEAFGDADFDSDQELLDRSRELVRRRVTSIADTLGLTLDAAALGLVHVSIGKPAPLLVDYCTKRGAELLIVGTHARRGLDRLMLGSVAEALLRQAPCDVLIARTPLALAE